MSSSNNITLSCTCPNCMPHLWSLGIKGSKNKGEIPVKQAQANSNEKTFVPATARPAEWTKGWVESELVSPIPYSPVQYTQPTTVTSLEALGVLLHIREYLIVANFQASQTAQNRVGYNDALITVNSAILRLETEIFDLGKVRTHYFNHS